MVKLGDILLFYQGLLIRAFYITGTSGYAGETNVHGRHSGTKACIGWMDGHATASTVNFRPFNSRQSYQGSATQLKQAKLGDILKFPRQNLVRPLDPWSMDLSVQQEKPWRPCASRRFKCCLYNIDAQPDASATCLTRYLALL